MVKEGLFIVIDGLDGIGKGVIEQALVDYDLKRGRKVFDVTKYTKEHGRLPSPEDWMQFDTLLTAEPTYGGIGRVIREEMISNAAKAAGRNYSAAAKIQAYSLDRLVQLNMVTLPALFRGKNVVQSRSFLSTLNYQLLEAIAEGGDPEAVRRMILEHDGNKLEMKYAPDLLIIPTIGNPQDLERRRVERKKDGKDDDAIFENLEFQLRLKPLYESQEIRKLFENLGTKVVYLDAGISLESTKQQAVNIFEHFLSIR